MYTDFPRLPQGHKCKRTGIATIDSESSFLLPVANGAQLFAKAWALVLRDYSEDELLSFGLAEALSAHDHLSVPDFHPCTVNLAKETKIGGAANKILLDTRSVKPDENVRSALIYQSGDDAASWLNTEWAVNGTSFDGLALVVHVSSQPSDFELNACFDPDVVSLERMTWILKHLRYAMETLAADDSIHQGTEFVLFSKQDMIQLEDWNLDLPSYVDGCVQDRIQDFMVSHPTKQAIQAWDGTLTYSELDHLASIYAVRLRAFGVKPEVLVPFCLGKSKWTPVAMLAILRAGGACVAIDPSHPVERLKVIIEDANAKVAIVSGEHAEFMRQLVPSTVVVWEEVGSHQADTDATMSALIDKQESDTDSPRACNPAFVYFTSGSTGVPKGIVIEHGAFCSSVRSHAPALRLGAQSRTLQFAAHTYGKFSNIHARSYNSHSSMVTLRLNLPYADVSVGEIFSTLMVGGTVCIPSDEGRLNDLAGSINSLGANWAFLTPTVASTITPDGVPTLMTLVLGGEHATTDNFAAWTGGHVCLINSYGPAECSIWSTCRFNVPPGADPAVMGHRVGCKMWVTDEHNHDLLVAVGCPGELVIEGPIIGRGYLNDKSKTKAAFITNPAWSQPFLTTRRFYKTGDIVRYNPDGSVSFVRRKDTQVKVRGQRQVDQ
jgi:non-ribosomal peptide synthetase component F